MRKSHVQHIAPSLPHTHTHTHDIEMIARVYIHMVQQHQVVHVCTQYEMNIQDTVVCSNDSCTDHFPVHVQTVRHASAHAGAIDLSPSVATDHSTSTPAFSTSNQTIVTLTLQKQQHCNAI